MKIGFDQVDITPPLGTSMCGQLFEYRGKGIESNLYATAMYLDDDRTRIAIVSCDLVMITNEIAIEIRDEAEIHTGIPAANIILCATHTHSGPSVVNVLGSSADRIYLSALKKSLIEVIEKACSNSKEGKLEYSQGELEGYAFNRRFLMSDGTISTHPLKMDPNIVEAEGHDSKALKVLCGYDEFGNPLGAVVNFGCHATVMERENELFSSDYPGKLAKYVSGQLGSDSVCMFLQGACGDICQVNCLDNSRKEVGIDWVNKMGRDIGVKAMELIHNPKIESRGYLRVITETIEIPRRMVDPKILDWANRHKYREVEIPRLSNYGVEIYNEIKLPLLSLDGLFRTVYWANFYSNEIKIMDRLQKDQPLIPLIIKVLSQDNWAMVALPCELFVEWSLAICESSPFENTIVVELANGWCGYIPTRKAFERHGGYETKEVTSTMLIPEAGDMVFQTVIKMLKTAKS
jgi:hypothetical protein